MRKFFPLKLIFIFALPLYVSAHGSIYLEFNPDKSNSLKDADVATPSQTFLAQNDFISGFDIWVANPGTSGTAAFQILNEQGILLTTKSVTIPSIPLTSNGTPFHVDLNSQLPVLADGIYTIRITTSMPELRLYYSNRVQVVSHNAPFTSEYLNGVAYLGSEEQLFSFKFALYEVNETSAPIISNVGWSVVSPTQMRVDFNANESVDYKIDYGPANPPNGGYTQGTNFLGGYEFCTQGISTCIITIPVSSNTTYQYAITAKDVWGNQSQFTGIFVSGQGQTPAPTLTPVDDPPVITNLRIVDLTNNKVSFAWTTNEIANSFVLISFSKDYITITSKNDSAFELEHFLETDPVLGAGTTYIATIRSRDITNHETSASLSFTTLSNQPTPSPLPTSSPPPPTSSPLPTGGPSPSATVNPAQTTPQPSNQMLGVTTSFDGGIGIIQWSSSEKESSNGYRVDIFDKNGNLKKSVLIEDGSHSLEVGGLEDGEYTVIVYENDDGVFKKIDKPKELKEEETFMKRLFGFWWALVPLLAGLSYMFWRNLNNKKMANLHVVP